MSAHESGASLLILFFSCAPGRASPLRVASCTKVAGFMKVCVPSRPPARVRIPFFVCGASFAGCWRYIEAIPWRALPSLAPSAGKRPSRSLAKPLRTSSPGIPRLPAPPASLRRRAGIRPPAGAGRSGPWPTKSYGLHTHAHTRTVQRVLCVANKCCVSHQCACRQAGHAQALWV